MDSQPLNDQQNNQLSDQPSDKPSKFQSLLLSILSLLAILFITLTLQASWHNPQEQTKLDLLQTDLILQASQSTIVKDTEIKGNAKSEILQSLLSEGGNSTLVAQALESYQKVLNANNYLLENLLENRQASENAQDNPISKQLQKKLTSISELRMRSGLLQTQINDIQGAIATWQSIQEIEQSSMSTYGMTAQILQGLWSEPQILFPDAESQIRRTLDGWYRQVALMRLYQVQQRNEKLSELFQQVQIEQDTAINRLVIVNSIPLIGGSLGIILWLGLSIQWLFFRKRSPFYVDRQQSEGIEILSWQVPWGLAKTWEVMVLWFSAFCLMTQLVIPLVLELLGISLRVSEDFTLQAWLVLIPYVLSVAPMLPILHLSLEKYQPLPQGWFSFKFFTPQWLLWGIGGYFAAVPLVLIVSLISQKFLQGQGGGNPLLPILIDSQNALPKFLLWSTLAIAAPFFEEYLFRGFLLPSLTKYLPVWGAIAASGFLFALAHLNLADIIPLTVLGMVMGFVYWRSRNLLASMLLHCLWNSGSFLALIALGGK
jgi:membrane protease YdiL (CAAX protease family)